MYNNQIFTSGTICDDELFTLSEKEVQESEEDTEKSVYRIFTKDSQIDEDTSDYDIIDETKNIDNKFNNGNDQYIIPKICFLENIILILQRIGIPKDILIHIKKEYLTKKDLDNLKYFSIKQKRKKRIKKTYKEKNRTERGRKSKYSEIKGKHDKSYSDNIMKKIKRILFSNVIKYIIEFIQRNKRNLKCNFNLKKFNYSKYVNQTKKESDIIMLNTPLKILVSKEINGKSLHSCGEDWNKNIIKNILKEE